MRITLFLGVFISVWTCFAQVHGQWTYTRALDFSDADSYLAPHPGSGGNLLVGTSLPGPNYSLTVVQLDTQGQTIAAYTLGGNQYHQATDLERLADGTYAVCGLENNVGSQSAFILLLDSNGLARQISRSDPAVRYFWKDLLALSDGGFLVAGYALETTQAPKRGVVIRYDARQDTLWSREISFPTHHTRLLSATCLQDGDLLLHGTATDTLTFVNKHFLCRMSSSGDMRWLRAYSAQPHHNFLCEQVLCNAAGQIFLGGFEINELNNDSHPVLFAFDAAGILLWAHLLNQIPYCSILAVESLPTGGVVLAGLEDDGFGNQYGLAATMSSAGIPQWVRRFDDVTRPKWTEILPQPDGGLLFSGYANNSCRVYKTNAMGLIGGHCTSTSLSNAYTPATVLAHTLVPQWRRATHHPFDTISSSPRPIGNIVDCSFQTSNAPQDLDQVQMQVYPQPMYTTAHLQVPAGKLTKHAQIQFFDAAGHGIAPIVTRLADGFEIQRGGLPAGIYAYQVLQGGQRITSGKLWIAD